MPDTPNAADLIGTWNGRSKTSDASPCEVILTRLTARLTEAESGDENEEALIGSLSAAINALTGMHAARRALAGAALEDGRVLRGQLVEAGHDREALVADLKDATQEIETLRAGMELRMHELAGLRDDLRLLKVKRDELQLVYGNAAAEAAHYKAQAEAADATAARLTAERNTAQARVAELEGELRQATDALAARDDETATARDLRASLDIAIAERDALKAKLAPPKAPGAGRRKGG